MRALLLISFFAPYLLIAQIGKQSSITHQYIQEDIEESHKSGTHHYYLGKQYLHQKSPHKALEAFQAYATLFDSLLQMEQSPSIFLIHSTNSHLALARVYQTKSLSNPNKSQAHFEQAMKIFAYIPQNEMVYTPTDSLLTETCYQLAYQHFLQCHTAHKNHNISGVSFHSQQSLHLLSKIPNHPQSKSLFTQVFHFIQSTQTLPPPAPNHR